LTLHLLFQLLLVFDRLERPRNGQDDIILWFSERSFRLPVKCERRFPFGGDALLSAVSVGHEKRTEQHYHQHAANFRHDDCASDLVYFRANIMK
jgi:hypothetical protein